MSGMDGILRIAARIETGGLQLKTAARSGGWNEALRVYRALRRRGAVDPIYMAVAETVGAAAAAPYLQAALEKEAQILGKLREGLQRGWQWLSQPATAVGRGVTRAVDALTQRRPGTYVSDSAAGAVDVGAVANELRQYIDQGNVLYAISALETLARYAEQGILDPRVAQVILRVEGDVLRLLARAADALEREYWTPDVRGAWESFRSGWQQAGEAVLQQVRDVREFARRLWNSVVSTAGELRDAIVEWVTNQAVPRIAQVIQSAIEDLKVAGAEMARFGTWAAVEIAWVLVSAALASFDLAKWSGNQLGLLLEAVWNAAMRGAIAFANWLRTAPDALETWKQRLEDIAERLSHGATPPPPGETEAGPEEEAEGPGEGPNITAAVRGHLIRLADRCDSEGAVDLADRIDSLLLSL